MSIDTVKEETVGFNYLGALFEEFLVIISIIDRLLNVHKGKIFSLGLLKNFLKILLYPEVKVAHCKFTARKSSLQL